MAKRLAVIALLFAAPILTGAVGSLETVLRDADPSKSVQGLTVHEWGTFTSVAGRNGKAIEWRPAGGPTDLPCFVILSGAGPKGPTRREEEPTAP